MNLQRQLRRREAELDELWRENAARTKKAVEELVQEGSVREPEARVGRGAPGQAGRHPRGRDGADGKSGPRVVGGRARSREGEGEEGRAEEGRDFIEEGQ